MRFIMLDSLRDDAVRGDSYAAYEKNLYLRDDTEKMKNKDTN